MCNCAGIVILNESCEKVLLVKPANKSNGFLSFPKGGFINGIDHDLFACAIRELHEETGLDPSMIKFAETITFQENSLKGHERRRYWVAKTIGEPSMFTFDKKEIMEVKWYDIKTVLTNKPSNLLPSRYDIIKNIEAQKTRWIWREPISLNKSVESKESSTAVPMEIEPPQPKPKEPFPRESRLLVKLLRHHLSEFKHDAEGFVDVRFIIPRLCTTKRLMTLSDIRELVKFDNEFSKQRLCLIEDAHGAKIRANQGHSNVDDLTAIYERITTPSPWLVHGTKSTVVDAIKRTGLSRMGRTHIHCIDWLSFKENGKAISGFRASSDMVAFVDMIAAMKAGIIFERSQNQVVLTKGDENGVIPVQFLEFKTMKEFDYFLHNEAP
jgi:2'-phosphotransferase